MDSRSETLVVWAKVSPDAKLVLDVPDSFKGKMVSVRCTLTDDPEVPRDKKGWPIGFWDSVYGSITDPTFERPPQGEMPPAPNFDE